MVKDQASKEMNPGRGLTDIISTKMLQVVKTFCHTRCMQIEAAVKQQQHFSLCGIQQDTQPLNSHAVTKQHSSVQLCMFNMVYD